MLLVMDFLTYSHRSPSATGFQFWLSRVFMSVAFASDDLNASLLLPPTLHTLTVRQLDDYTTFGQ